MMGRPGGGMIRAAGMGRPGLGQPPERSKDLRETVRRLLARLRPERVRLVIVLVFGVTSVALLVTGPKILGAATNVLFDGVVGKQLPAGVTKEQAVALLRAHGQGQLADMISGMNITPGTGVDITQLGRILALAALVYLLGAAFGWGQGFIIAGVTQRTMYGLRREVEEKLARLPLRYFDSHPHGDILSRVTNDIDNLSTTQIASQMNMLQSGLASAERVFEFLDAPEEAPERAPAAEGPSSARPSQVAGRITLEHVSFRYEPDKPLIEDFTLEAAPGQTIAIVGQTGAGKTTVVNLLMRFYEIDAGIITLDGTDYRDLTRDQVRRCFGMVLQDTWLFAGTIRDNIGYGKQDATAEEIVAAARAAYADHFIRTLPDGYDTLLDEDASNLSSGQKQLLTIARAFLASPPILILDEATSNVDTRTEILIQEAMSRLRQGRTSFVIAHRLSTIRNADTIIVMDAGRIVEQGNHADLLRRRGVYYSLYDSQFTEDLAEAS